MGAGTVALSVMCLLLGQVPGQAPDLVMHTNSRSLRIPINFEDARRGEFRELLLFASWDQGRSYQQVASVMPDRNEFIFEARNDGLCWLKVAVINRQGKQEPDNIQQLPPDQKIVVDTMKPVLRTFSAQRLGDDVTAAWEVLEDNFDPQGFRLEYQAKDNPSSFWTTVPATPTLSGQKTFRPSGSGPLTVRLIIKDKGGNQSLGIAEVAGGGNAVAGNPVAVNAVGYSPPPAPAPNLMPAVAPPITPPTPPVALAGNALPAPPPLEPAKPQVANTWNPVHGGAPEPRERLVATSEKPSEPLPTAPVVPERNLIPASVVRKTMPPTQYVNRPEVMLEYELSKVGPSGLGSVELWWTRNDGQSWELYAMAPIEGNVHNGRHQRPVELPGEGVFGFVLVVKSRAGLGKAPPRAGDAPEIRVEVDTTPPLAKLYSPSPDPQRPGALILNWVAKDKNLSNNPITLEWSETREGPWHAIAVGIPNTGQHSWQLPDRLPVQVYMRLRVRDVAGNESVATTQDPQLVDLSEPEGHLTNVSVSPR